MGCNGVWAWRTWWNLRIACFFSTTNQTQIYGYTQTYLSICYIHSSHRRNRNSAKIKVYGRALWLTTPKINDEMPARSLGYVNAIPMDGNIFLEPKQQQQRKRNLFRFLFLREWVSQANLSALPPPISIITHRAYIPVRAN